MKVLHRRPDAAPSFVTSVAAESAESRRGGAGSGGEIFLPQTPNTDNTRQIISGKSSSRHSHKNQQQASQSCSHQLGRCFSIDVDYDSKSELDEIVLFFKKK